MSKFFCEIDFGRYDSLNIDSATGLLKGQTTSFPPVSGRKNILQTKIMFREETFLADVSFLL